MRRVPPGQRLRVDHLEVARRHRPRTHRLRHPSRHALEIKEKETGSISLPTQTGKADGDQDFEE